MATETEIKLAVGDLQLLDCILCSKQITELMDGGFSYTKMQSTYYDTPNGDFFKNHQTLRLRKENETSVLCFKSPQKGRSRMEWQTPCEYLDEGLPKLASLGAPAMLKDCKAEELNVLCGAEFTRISAQLQFSDGSRCELAGDIGQLLGGGKQLPLCELELELTQGDAAQMLALGKTLCEKFGVKECFESKFARASALANE